MLERIIQLNECLAKSETLLTSKTLSVTELIPAVTPIQLTMSKMTFVRPLLGLQRGPNAGKGLYIKVIRRSLRFRDCEL